MANILIIETATQVCSVGLSVNGNMVAEKESYEQNAHSKVLNGFIDKIISESDIALKDWDAVAVSKGPGSYTGLRIGVSSAKGLCYALDLPLLAFDTLYSIAKGTLNKAVKENILFCPMIDARRMEVYCTFYDKDLQKIEDTSAEIIYEDSFKGVLDSHIVIFSGDGSAKCKKVIHHPNAIFIEDIHPLARNMGERVEQLFNEKDFVDLAYFEPYYLKDFVAGIPKVKGLR